MEDFNTVLDIVELELVCEKLIKDSDLSVITLKNILRQAEEKLKFEKGFLSKPDTKKTFKSIVDKILASLDNTNENEKVPTPDKEKNDVTSTTITNSNDSEYEKTESISDLKSSETGINNSDSDFETPKKSAKNDSEKSQNESHGSDFEEASKIKKSQSQTDPKVKKSPKSKKESTKPSGNKSQLQKRIESRKTYIKHCGIKKRWKEIEDMSLKQQADYLDNFLVGLGMVGRPSLEKCKALKEKIELKREYEDMMQDAQKIIPVDQEIQPRESLVTKRKLIRRKKDFDSDEEQNALSTTENVENSATKKMRSNLIVEMEKPNKKEYTTYTEIKQPPQEKYNDDEYQPDSDFEYESAKTTIPINSSSSNSATSIDGPNSNSYKNSQNPATGSTKSRNTSIVESDSDSDAFENDARAKDDKDNAIKTNISNGDSPKPTLPSIHKRNRLQLSDSE
ncbi:hypothetical protein AYI70_g2045 [Smittium culicis]|uniref:DEK C-terminal domain-containing protein n=1 Tax=Smittium culicis TaxID=133412 RepID=A0A1R1YA69_9FUNG|nr:hypothetical protein AYI70_g2045 [Smittium culicis]